MTDKVDVSQIDSTTVGGVLLSKVAPDYNEFVDDVAKFRAATDVDSEVDSVVADAADDSEIGKLRDNVAKAEKFLKDSKAELARLATEAATKELDPNFDVDKTRARIRDTRNEIRSKVNGFLTAFMAIGSVTEEVNDRGRVTGYTANDTDGEILLQMKDLPRIGKNSTGSPSNTDANKNREVREWGRNNGWPELANRGAIPHEVLSAYADAHTESE